MGVRGYVNGNGRFSNLGNAIRQDILEDHPRELLENVYTQKAAHENNRSVDVDHKKFFFFQRLKSGRRCSCFVDSTSPSSDCPICFRTGVVGGYEKWGTHTVVVDTTYPDLRLINIDILWDFRPVIFRLNDKSLKGHVEFKIDLLGNNGKMDIFQVLSQAKRGANVKAFIKASEDVNYDPLTTASAEALLGNNRVWVLIELSRKDFETPPPQLSHLFFRYLLRNDAIVKGDTPRETQSIIMSEFGIQENFSTIGIFFDDTVARIDNEDFVATPENRRYKIIEVQAFVQGRVNTSWDVQARWINDYEPFFMVPL